MGYRVKTDVFEGPFALMVYLIEHARMSIYDIRIAEITDQYLEYVGDMEKADVGAASEFMALAALLLEIKSKMLLPRAPVSTGEGEAVEDPRTELVAKLLEYKKFKAASEMLERRMEENSGFLEKPQEDLNEYTGEPDEYLALDIEQFVSAFERFLDRKRKLEEIRRHHMRSERQRITTELRMEDIRTFFKERPGREADFRELVQKKNDRYDTAVTFSSVLEMMKQQRLEARQHRLFGDIMVRATKRMMAEPDAGSAGDGANATEDTEVKEMENGQ
ncbi:MAG TPA: segregation/condensation protein A [Candidatus Copromorpha excrementipullorum]|uniref:Segregation and condensation protein A n=1 Tax=Candidatus Allocopromorpha excrementipullorum TaxID=2840743 RepID=A0A9D1SUP9_9FIRM|nr:segregation/condensation protein A [Candidatus Copromorpha excrementipullorum]